MNEQTKNKILNAQKGDKSALGELLKEEIPSIKAMVFYLKKDMNDINDILQDILFKISKKIHQLKNLNSYKTWLNQIVINSYYDYLRKNKKYSKEAYLDETINAKYLEIPDFSSNPSDSILNNELDYIIKTSIDKLPIHYKIPITLREIQGLSYDEISDVINKSVGTVKSRIARARAIIKDDINKYIGE